MTPAVDQVQNVCCALEYYGRATRDGDMSFVRSAVDLPVFNMAVLRASLRGEQKFQECIETAARFYQAHQTGWSFWLCEDLLDRPAARAAPVLFHGLGLHCVAETPGMERDGVPPVARALPELDCQRADCRTALADFGGIVAQAFNVPTAAAALLYADPERWGSALQAWVAYHHGMPVATAVSAVAAGVVGLYSVATHPSWRRRGYAEAIMRRAMAEAQAASGLGRFVLQSSPAGLHLYRKMGFRKISSFLVYATS